MLAFFLKLALNRQPNSGRPHDFTASAVRPGPICDQSELGLAANRAGARTERGRRERVWTKPNAAGRMFSGWTIWGSNVPGLFACFYPVGGITLWP